MKNKTILMILATLLMLPMAFASSDIYRIQGIETNLSIFCSEPYNYCDYNTSCNISIIDQEGKIKTSQGLMTREGDSFYYKTTFDSAGDYKANYICKSNSDYGAKTNNIQVLSDDYSFSNSGLLSTYILLAVGAIGLIFFALFLINKNIVIGFTSATIILVLSLFVWTQGLFIQINDYTTILYYQVPSIISGAIGFVLVVFSLWLYWYSATYSDEEDGLLEYEYREQQ